MLKLKLTKVHFLKIFSVSKNLKAFLLLYLSFLAQFSCNTTEPPLPPETKPTLTLALDDTSCTEAWLQLTTKDLELPAELTLKQYNPTGDSVSQIFVLNTQDSLLYVDSLLTKPNIPVSKYPASSIKYPVSSNQLKRWTPQATTLPGKLLSLGSTAAVYFTMLP